LTADSPGSAVADRILELLEEHGRTRDERTLALAYSEAVSAEARNMAVDCSRTAWVLGDAFLAYWASTQDPDDLESARGYYERALEFRDATQLDRWQSHNALGTILLEKGDPRAALRHFTVGLGFSYDDDTRQLTLDSIQVAESRLR
jgi:hypothetical protein